jgi:hypothetical protein
VQPVLGGGGGHRQRTKSFLHRSWDMVSFASLLQVSHKTPTSLLHVYYKSHIYKGRGNGVWVIGWGS